MKNVQGAIDHLRTHQNYPATKDELVKECKNLSDFSEEDKQWFMNHLPDRTYKSADDIIQALGWQGQAMMA